MKTKDKVTWLFIRQFFFFFYSLITYRVYEKRKYYNHKIEKKENSLPLINIQVLYVLEHKISKTNFRLSVCTYIHTWILAVDTITFEEVSRSKQNLVGVFYV